MVAAQVEGKAADAADRFTGDAAKAAEQVTDDAADPAGQEQGGGAFT